MVAGSEGDRPDSFPVMSRDHFVHATHPLMSQAQLLAPQMPLVPAPDVPTGDQVAALVGRFGLMGRVDLQRLCEMVDGHPALLEIALGFLEHQPGATMDDLWAQANQISGIFATHLQEVERLVRGSGYLEHMRTIAQSSEPTPFTKGEAELKMVRMLVRFGVVRELDRCLEPSCLLYRCYFQDLF